MRFNTNVLTINEYNILGMMESIKIAIKKVINGSRHLHVRVHYSKILNE